MSSMLEQAIIDAKALKEQAMKNAESIVIEKYSDQIKEAVSSLLEQEEEDPFADPMLDPAGAEGLEATKDPALEEIPAATASDTPDEDGPVADDDTVVFDLDKLKKKIASISAEDGEMPEPEVTSDEIATDLAPAVDAMPDASAPADLSAPAPLAEEEEMSEETDDLFEIDDSVVEEIMERLKVDINPQKPGWLNGSEEQMQEYEDMMLAREQDDEVKEENEQLRAAVKELEEAILHYDSTNKGLTEENSKLKSAVYALKEKVELVNVSNAKLLYINKALENPSLNERQRRKVVEAISIAESPKEAKVIYETLQSTVGSTEKKPLPKSLSEAVNRSPSLILNSRRNKKESNDRDMFSERLQRLAGIKK